MTFEIIQLRDFGIGRKLVAIWDGELHVAQLEYRANDGLITDVFALTVNASLRKKGYGRRIVKEIINNAFVRVHCIEPRAAGFWKKVTNKK